MNTYFLAAIVLFVIAYLFYLTIKDAKVSSEETGGRGLTPANYLKTKIIIIIAIIMGVLSLLFAISS